MSKVKLRKSELKIQRDSLKKYERFLPILQLKKQQLQIEIWKIDKSIKEVILKRDSIIKNMQDWMELFGYDKEFNELSELISVKKLVTDYYSIAGIDVPVYVDMHFNDMEYNLFYDPIWIKDATEIICDLTKLNAMIKILMEQKNILGNELRLTTQRVNLFEKIKIPECKENIRVIQIYLSDQQVAAICNSKMAKRISARSKK